MTTDEVTEAGRTLRAYATHFAPRDWDWTRDTDIHRILYKNRRRRTRSGKTHWFDPSRLPYRVREAFQGLLRDLWRRTPLGRPDTLDRAFGISPWRMFRARLRMNNGPDGILDGGGVIVYWEETGEYIQLVQPSVGALLADFLEQEPSHPHALLIAGEIRRIQDRYRARVKARGGDTV